MAPTVFWRVLRSPLGPLTVVECDDGPLVIEFAGRPGAESWAERVRARVPGVTIELGGCDGVVHWLEHYFDGRMAQPAYPEHLARWLAPSAAQEAVWRALCEIPPGETRSYEDIAHRTGLNPRVVGQLNGANHLAVLIPCHRVVGKNGALVGYGGGLDRKRWLLDHELRAVGLGIR
ncbi:MAG: methylated-DNA--[protein]-cysteine S-methyltransferase [Gemmatimonadota bacterium]